jgi:hypothetical protein
MSEHNYLGLLFKANLEQNPKLMDLDITTFQQELAVRRVAAQKLNPIKPEPAQQELNRLRGQLFALQQNAKAYEVLVNNTSGNVREFERRITTLLKIKKEHDDANNLMGARSYEHQIQGLETELIDARENLVKEQRWNGMAARALRTWQTENTPRLLELRKQVG